MIDLPHCRPISKNDDVPSASRSTTASMIDAHLVDVARVARHDRQQRVFPALGIVVAVCTGRQLVNRASAGTRGSGEPCANASSSDSASSSMAPFVTCTWLPPSSFLSWCGPGIAKSTRAGPGDHHLRGVLHDHRVVARRDAGGADARHRAECERHRRGDREVREDDVPAPHLRDRRASDLLDRLHRTATAHAVDEADVGQPQLEREALGMVALGADRRVGRAAAHGEVVARDDDRPAVDRRRRRTRSWTA